MKTGMICIHLSLFLMEEHYRWLRSNAYMRILSSNTPVLWDGREWLTDAKKMELQLKYTVRLLVHDSISM
jgi:hypothetical protein